jgi:hypothetical protein
MPFKKIETATYPPRHWAIVGDPGSGKSTFASQMAGPILVVDADHRFQEVARLAQGSVYTLDDAGNDAEAIAGELHANMGGAGIRTIVVDSLTAIISPLVAQAVMANDAGVTKNRVAAYKPKAMALRLLQDSITGWGTDTLWIYHTRQGLDSQARQVTSTSISAVELARLRRSLNMVLRVNAHNDQRSITIEWARCGRSGITLDDTTSLWRGMPERIEMAVYDGLTLAETTAMEQATPTSFSSREEAIAWGYEQGCFKDALHAQNAYEEVKRVQQPKHSSEMWALWVVEVLGRKSAPENPFDDNTIGVRAEIEG